MISCVALTFERKPDLCMQRYGIQACMYALYAHMTSLLLTSISSLLRTSCVWGTVEP